VEEVQTTRNTPALLPDFRSADEEGGASADQIRAGAAGDAGAVQSAGRTGVGCLSALSRNNIFLKAIALAASCQETKNEKF